MNIIETFTLEAVCEAAKAHYATGPRPNILQYPCDYVPFYELHDEPYFFPTVCLVEGGYYWATVEEGGGVEDCGLHATFEEAAFAAHDRAYDLWELETYREDDC